jgi:hypothetical protein
MRADTNDIFRRLCQLFEERAAALSGIQQAAGQPSVREWQRRGMQSFRHLKRIEQQIQDFLETDLLRYPPGHLRVHGPKLKDFHAVAPFEKSVFIMTKFPDGRSPRDAQLKVVISEVKQSIKLAGFTPRIARHEYHDWLWHNVELYLLGCARGVAIIEDRCRSEFNPNVAFEWGWMKGMARRVYFLAEERFAHERADWKGLISKTFSWKNPRAGIREAMTSWLKKESED